MKNTRHKLVALLPMKFNSQRVPGKNFKNLCGKPLFRWMLDTLLSIQEIDLIVINTDAKSELEKFGIVCTERLLIRERISDICGDSVSMNLVLNDDIKNIDSEMYLMTHTTNPFLSVAAIKNALEVFGVKQNINHHDSLFSVSKVQGRFYNSDRLAINHDPDNLVPTQELPPWYLENSNLYIFTADSFKKTNARIGERPIMFETNAIESVDIDTPEDWELAEALARYFLNKDTKAI